MPKIVRFLWFGCFLLLPSLGVGAKKDTGYCALIYYAKTIDEKKAVHICARTKTIEYKFGDSQNNELDVDLVINKSALSRNSPKGKDQKYELFIPNGNIWYVLTIGRTGSYIKIYDTKANSAQHNLLSLFNIVRLSKPSQINNIENLKELKYHSVAP